MNARQFHRVWIGAACIAACALLTGAAEQSAIPLPAPKMEGGKPLMQTLKERKSTKEYRAQNLTNEILSNLLWAAYGINRPDSGKRTVASAKNMQEIDLYVAAADGAFLYDAAANQLKKIVGDDLRKKSGGGSFAGVAAVELIYVADFSKSGGKSDADKFSYAAITTGGAIQNVYLLCASENLGAVTHVCGDPAALAQALGLKPEQHIIMSQTVGYPAQ